MQSVSNLTLSQEELLTVLAEECAEIIQVICKIKRHGYLATHPFLPEDRNNKEELEKELGDVLAILKRLLNNGELSSQNIEAYKEEKLLTGGKWLHYN